MLLQHSQEQNGKEATMNKREREMRGKSSSITIAQDMVYQMSEGGVLFILGKAKLPLLDELQVSHIKEKSLLGFW
jgi:hypothetical protein